MNLPELTFQFWTQIIATVLGGLLAATVGMLISWCTRKNEREDKKNAQHGKGDASLFLLLPSRHLQSIRGVKL